MTKRQGQDAVSVYMLHLPTATCPVFQGKARKRVGVAQRAHRGQSCGDQRVPWVKD